MYSAPIIWSSGISSGKLKGVISAVGPYGHRNPAECWPKWSPGCPKLRASMRTCVWVVVVVVFAALLFNNQGTRAHTAREREPGARRVRQASMFLKDECPFKSIYIVETRAAPGLRRVLFLQAAWVACQRAKKGTRLLPAWRVSAPGRRRSFRGTCG